MDTDFKLDNQQEKFGNEFDGNDTKYTEEPSTFAIVGISCSADTFVVNQTLVLHIIICAKNPYFAKPENVNSQALTIQLTMIIDVNILNTLL